LPSQPRVAARPAPGAHGRPWGHPVPLATRRPRGANHRLALHVRHGSSGEDGKRSGCRPRDLERQSSPSCRRRRIRLLRRAPLAPLSESEPLPVLRFWRDVERWRDGERSPRDRFCTEMRPREALRVRPVHTSVQARTEEHPHRLVELRLPSQRMRASAPVILLKMALVGG
jgi:hypothetical protein